MPALELTNVHKSLSRRPVLNGIDLTVEEGKIAGLIGPNGVGKTTTMRVITGLIFPDEGSVQIMGHNLKTERETALACLSSVVEGPALYPQLTGKQHLQLMADLRGLPKSAVEEAADFTQLGDRLKDRVPKYSMGMKQRLALALCLMTKPKLLLLDEPTNGLDPTSVMQLRRELKQVAAGGTAVLISSHILSELQKTADMLIFLNAGKVSHVVENSGEQDVEALYLQEFGGEAE